MKDIIESEVFHKHASPIGEFIKHHYYLYVVIFNIKIKNFIFYYYLFD
jgi:hypothetical protein